MALGKRLINTGAAAAACTTDSTDPFGDSSGIALYNLDYDASTAPDGTDYSGTPTDVEFGVDGQINYGARFNGSSSKIDVGNQTWFDSDFTLSMWFYPQNASGTSFQVLAYKRDNSDYTMPFGFGLYEPNHGTYPQKLSFGLGSSGNNAIYVYTTNTYNVNSWNHVAVKISGTAMSMTLNGIESTATFTGTRQTNTETIRFGNKYTVDGDYPFDGSIDQVRIFSKSLSSSEVSTLYAETACVYDCTTDTVDFPTTNLAYYKFDNSAEDETGNYDGTESNIEYRFGRYGQAGLFNGTNSYIYASNSVQQPTTSFSASVWVLFHQIKSSSVGVIGNFKTGVTPQVGWAIAHQNGTPLQFWADGTANSSGGMVQSTSSIPTNEWIHVVGTYDGSNVKIYINGSLENTKSYTQTPATTDQPLVIGRWYGNFNDLYTDGQIDQVRIFSTALDSNQVSQLYNEKPCEDTSNFKTVLYEGTGSTQFISNVGMDLETDGGLLWIKNRDTTDSHALVDSVRGISESGSNYIASDSTSQELSSTNMPSSLEKSGFFVQGGGGRTNTNNESYVAWVWKGGGDAVSNTDGTITSQVSANTEAGFSIVTNTSPAGAYTWGHGLSKAPELWIHKATDYPYGWETMYPDTFGQATGSNNPSDWNRIFLNTTAAATTNTVYSATDTVLSSTGWGAVNNFVTYCFHSVSGISSIGSYSGTGSSGNAITGLGFEPNWLMVKRTNASGSWLIVDNKRVESNGNLSELFADTTTAESGSGYDIDFTSDGFTLNTTTTNANASGTDNYIYMAFK